MERSFGNKYGKWIALAVVVLALGLWFYRSNGDESYIEKYKNFDLSVTTQDIGRDNTYDQYTGSASIYLPLTGAEGNEGVVYHAEVGQTADLTILTGEALPSDSKVRMTEDGVSFVRVDNVLEVPAGCKFSLTADIRYSGVYQLQHQHLKTAESSEAPVLNVMLDGAAAGDTLTLWVSRGIPLRQSAA